MIWSCNDLAEKKKFYSIVSSTRPTIVTNEMEHIIGISKSWVLMCGFRPEESFGCTPRILQGPLTNTEAAAAFTSQIRQDRIATTTLINYKKDGTPFRNSIVGFQIGDILVAQTYAESAL